MTEHVVDLAALNLRGPLRPSTHLRDLARAARPRRLRLGIGPSRATATSKNRPGQTLGFLDDAPGLGWAARLAGRGELDVLRLWQSVRRAAPGGPRVLPGLPRAELWTEIRPGSWEAMLELFRVAFPITVIDAGFCLEEDEELLYDQVRLRRNAVTRLAVEQADLVVAVARADPVGLHAFIRGYQDLRDLGVPASRVRVVVNQLRPGMFATSRRSA